MISIGVPYKQFDPEERFDAIVIGSGIGGLATAALLARHADQRVLLTHLEHPTLEEGLPTL